MKLKICFFTSLYPPHLGGVERLTDLLARELVKAGLEVTVITSNTHDLSEYENLSGVNVYRLPVYKLMDSRFPVPKPSGKTAEILNKALNRKPNAIIVNMRFYPLSLLGMRTARQLKVPLISYEHVSGHFTVNNPVLDFAGRAYEHFTSFLMKKNADLFLAVSKKAGEWLNHFGINYDGVVYNCIDPAMEANPQPFLKKYDISPDKKIISFAGRILKEKGVSFLAEGFRRIESINDFILAIAGSGPFLKTLTKEVGNDRNIILTGELTYRETINLIAASHIYVLPSLYPEGLPTTLLEAGLFGVPVIATSMGGTEELIEHEKSGIIIQPGSSRDITDAINKLNDDKELYKSLSKNLQAVVTTDFSSQRSAAELIKYIRKVC